MGTTALRRCGYFFAMLALASAPAQAQAVLPDTSTIRVSTDLVQLPVLAFRVPFRPAPGLRVGFTIRLDGGPPFHPSYVRVEGTEPIGVSVVVDLPEPDEAEPVSHAMQAAFQAWPAELLHEEDGVSFYAAGCRLMRSSATRTTGAARALLLRAASSSIFQDALKGGPACPRPRLDLVLQTTMAQSSTTYPWRVVLLLTRGEQTFDPAQLQTLRDVAALHGITLFAIRYSRESSPDTSNGNLDALVSSLGGVSLASSYADLGRIMETILGAVRQRYILSLGRRRPGRNRNCGERSASRPLRLLARRFRGSCPGQCGPRSGRDRGACGQPSRPVSARSPRDASAIDPARGTRHGGTRKQCAPAFPVVHGS